MSVKLATVSVTTSQESRAGEEEEILGCTLCDSRVQEESRDKTCPTSMRNTHVWSWGRGLVYSNLNTAGSILRTIDVFVDGRALTKELCT